MLSSNFWTFNMWLRKLLLFLETKNLKNLKFGLLGFFRFFENLKNLGFLKATSTALNKTWPYFWLGTDTEALYNNNYIQ